MNDSPENPLAPLRHSLAHLLAAAVLELYPNAKPAIGPAIEHGFYYDFDFGDVKISEDDLPKIEEKMRAILKDWTTFQSQEITKEEAEKRFAENPYKLHLVEAISAAGEPLTLYTSGPPAGGFTDLCKGGHIDNAQDIDPDAFALDRVAGAYWLGDENNPMLTRIYGLAFSTNKELDKFRALREEARKRDHRKLGKELDLFLFSDLVGAGLPLWTPRGTLVRNLLDNYVWELRKAHGYQQVDIPHLTKKDLYEKSGHWEKFGDELFKVTSREGHEFVIKPMNCPHHTQIYNRRLHSYRELPQRYANTTKVYRDEQSGELAGLTRVRSITQDDAHVFCRYSQTKKEILRIWDIVETFYETTTGFKLWVRLSLHDPANADAYLGSEEVWNKAEHELRELVTERGMEAVEAPGEAAFYGPKLDFMTRDSLGREWQVATIQLDMNLPERFDLVCINEKGEHERIVMLHAAIMGSLERFIAPLLEHTAGALPLWLSPTQVKVLPVSEAHTDYAQQILEQLLEANIRAELDASDESLGKRIRAAKLEKTPVLFILGNDEMENSAVTAEHRDGTTEKSVAPETVIKSLNEKIRTRARD